MKNLLSFVILLFTTSLAYADDSTDNRTETNDFFVQPVLSFNLIYQFL